MNKKNLTLIGIIFTAVVAIILVILNLTKGIQGGDLLSQNSEETIENDMDTNSNDAEKNETSNIENALMSDLEELSEGQLNPNATTYVFTDSKAQYKVDKVFISKPLEEVTGETAFEGTAIYDSTTGLVKIIGMVDLVNLSTGSQARDIDVMSRLQTPIAYVSGDIQIEPDLTGEQTITTELEITITEETVRVPFDITYSLNEDSSEFTATGTGQTLISNFGIEPPSALNIYNVDDDLTLLFEVKGVLPETISQ